MNMRLAYVLFFFALLLSWYVGIHRTQEEPKGFKTPLSAPQPVLSAPGVEEPSRKPGSESSPRKPAQKAPQKRSGSAPLNPEAFRAKYGDHLQWLKAEGDRVIGIEAKSDRLEEWERNQRAEGSFSARNQEQVLARAHEIVSDAMDILKVHPDFPLQNPRASLTDFSAQVTYEQTYQGVPLSQGKVTVLLGPAGELRSLQSDYVQGVVIQNRAPSGSSTPGRTLLWVGERSSERAQARYVKEVRESGIQTVRDPDTGEVIYTRNRRMN